MIAATDTDFGGDIRMKNKRYTLRHTGLGVRALIIMQVLECQDIPSCIAEVRLVPYLA